MSAISAFFSGASISAGLIIPIGAQNAFVLKQGITRNYVFLTALCCFLIDAFLISLGVGGVGLAIKSHPVLLAFTKWGGILFLICYGLFTLKSAFNTSALNTQVMTNQQSLKLVLLMLFSVTLLNPHVYIDTVLLMGSIGAQQPIEEQALFTLGAVTVSAMWFFSLAYGAKLLAPVFAKPLAWKVLNLVIASMMLGIAYSICWVC